MASTVTSVPIKNRPTSGPNTTATSNTTTVHSTDASTIVPSNTTTASTSTLGTGEIVGIACGILIFIVIVIVIIIVVLCCRKRKKEKVSRTGFDNPHDVATVGSINTDRKKKKKTKVVHGKFDVPPTTTDLEIAHRENNYHFAGDAHYNPGLEEDQPHGGMPLSIVPPVHHTGFIDDNVAPSGKPAYKDYYNMSAILSNNAENRRMGNQKAGSNKQMDTNKHKPVVEMPPSDGMRNYAYDRDIDTQGGGPEYVNWEMMHGGGHGNLGYSGDLDTPVPLQGQLHKSSPDYVNLPAKPNYLDMNKPQK